MNLPYKNLKISLRLKILIPFLFLVIMMMLVVTHIFTIRELNLRVEQVKVRIERLAKNIATIRSVETEDWEVYQTYIDNQLQLNKDIIYIAIFDEQNDLKVHSLNTDLVDLENSEGLTRLDEANIIRQLEQRQIAEESQKDFESKSVNIIIGDRNKGTVNVGFSIVDLNDEMRANLVRNLTLAVIFIVLATIISLFISSRIVTPLSKLTKAMLKISEGDLQQEVHISSRDEIGEMAETFNYMTTGLREKGMIENFARELGFVIELNKIAQLITERITTALDANRGYLFLRNRKDPSKFQLEYSYPQPFHNEVTFRRNEALCHHFLSTRNPQPIRDLINQPALIDQLRDFTDLDENALIVPIIIKDEVNGILLLGGKNNNVPYREYEKTFLTTLIGQGTFAIESALLYQELTQQERLKQELEIARRVQRGLLPQQIPSVNGLDIDGICIPATEIGGDYYDFFQINEHTLGIAIADVTGKGTSAAFYMAVIKGIMLSLTSIYLSPRQLLRELNRQIFGKVDRKVFITMIYAVVDVKKKSLKFARAGHNALIMRRAEKSKAECLTPNGIGLGLEKGDRFDSTISEQQIKLQSGDTFLFYTDGVSEAMNHQREEFGEDRLLEIVENINHQSCAQIREKIIEEVNRFVRETPQHDDITIVTLRAI